MTQDDVRLDVSSILTDLGYTEAIDQFDFSLQPSQQIDRVYRLTLARTGTLAELGLGQIEEHTLTCWLARQAGGAPSPEACRSLTADLDLVEAALVRFSVTGDRWNVLDDTPRAEVSLPGPSDYVVGMLALAVDFDRDLSV